MVREEQITINDKPFSVFHNVKKIRISLSLIDTSGDEKIQGYLGVVVELIFDSEEL